MMAVTNLLNFLRDSLVSSRNEEMRQQSIGTILEFISNGLYRIHSCKPWPSFSSLVDSDARRTYTDFLLEYWYVWTVLFLFWPVFLNLFIAFATASGWIFWLFASVAVGIIQVVYAAYQFIVIFGDIVGLSILKTFAMLRAQALRLSFMSGMHIGKARKHNRRREWKRMLARATSYEKYCSILVEVPLSEDRSSVSMGNSGCWSFRFGLKNGPALPPHSQREALHVNGNEMLTSGACTDAYDNTSDKLDIASNGIKKRIPRVSSCATFSAGMLKQSYFQASSRTSRKSVDSSMHHSMSTANLPDDATSISSSSEEESEEDRRFRNCVEATLGMRGGMLVATTNRLREARIQASTESDTSTLKFLLPAVVKRNHLSVDDYLIDDARSVAESGRCRLPKEAKDVIYGFVDEVVKCLYWLSESPCLRELADLTRTSRRNSIDDGIEIQELSERIELVSKMRLNIGSTALMLSGGGAQAMYHLGTIRALVESATYDQIPVISGTSGGAITAAMCAMATGDEMVRDVCVPSVSTDFRRSGVMGKQNIRWFPTLWEMGAFWLKNRLLVDSKEFRRCCEYYFGDTTFEEAFRKTGKHVCIHVSASRAQSGAGTQRLLLNHISTPHVTISSAVAASCALPGVMKPAKLMAKNRIGNLVLFEVDGVDWIDGSVQADLPFKRIATMFNVSNFIVCQCNFHVVPLLNKEHHPGPQSLYWRLFQILEWDIRSRALNLGRLGLFPKFFGQDVSKVFKQKYHGNITLVPRFTVMQVFGLKALVNPSASDMEIYLQNGQMAAWPHLGVIKHMVRLETAVNVCVGRLQERLRRITAESHSDDVSRESDSAIVSSRIISDGLHLLGNGRERDLLAQIKTLEMENEALKKRLNMVGNA